MDDATDPTTVLEHHGIKGMKWGVRRTRSQIDGSRGGKEVEVLIRPGSKVKARGGRQAPPSADAVRVAGLKQRAKASTTDSLTTKELQDLTQRMNLEQQYKKLRSEQTSPGKKFIRAELKKASQGKGSYELVKKAIDAKKTKGK